MSDQRTVTVGLREIHSGDFIWEVSVPTETGSRCVIDFQHLLQRGFGHDTYRMEFSGELLDQSPEALTAAIQMALLALRASR